MPLTLAEIPLLRALRGNLLASGAYLPEIINYVYVIYLLGRFANAQYYKYHPWYLPPRGQLKLFKFIPDKFVLQAKLVLRTSATAPR